MASGRVPPYSRKDEAKLQEGCVECFLQDEKNSDSEFTCTKRGSTFSSWEALVSHLRHCHDFSNEDLKGTILYSMWRKERNAKMAAAKLKKVEAQAVNPKPNPQGMALDCDSGFDRLRALRPLLSHRRIIRGRCNPAIRSIHDASCETVRGGRVAGAVPNHRGPPPEYVL